MQLGADSLQRDVKRGTAIYGSANGQYDQIIRIDSNRLPETMIAGTGSKRWMLRLNMAATPPEPSVMTWL